LGFHRSFGKQALGKLENEAGDKTKEMFENVIVGRSA
jgi:hypothetical protein